MIDKEIENIIQKSKIDSFNVSKYDLEINTIKEIIEDITTVSLFSNKKLIIVDNSFIFSRVQNKKIDDIELIENYLNNCIKDVIVVFIDNNEKIDSNKKIVKFIKNSGIIKEFNKSKNITSNIKDLFGNYKINNDAIDTLLNKTGSNLEIIYQEIEKLKIYKINEKLITKQDIEELCCENIDVDIFKFIDDIINKNKGRAIRTYKELLKLNEEPIKIIALLASKFRLMYQACMLSKMGYTEENISEILNTHKYPVHLAIIAGYKYEPKVILKYLNDLASIDIGIKTGEQDKELALELFILRV